jgi:nucleoside-diphosphate-sugar epimerase
MFTVLGASGFIGGRVCARLRALGIEYFAPERDQPVAGRTLGSVIYCIGLTANFRGRPLETVEAHVTRLLALLHECEFDSLLYLSSTRLYRSSALSASEENALEMEPLLGDDLYNISKAMGESLALHCGRRARIARISNVYGDDFASDNFLSSVIRDAVSQGRVILRTSPDSERDYIGIDAVVDGLLQIASHGRHEIYNLASGVNVSNRVLVDRLHAITECAVEFLPNAPRLSFPRIRIERMKAEFDFTGSNVLADLDKVVNLYKEHLQTA